MAFRLFIFVNMGAYTELLQTVLLPEDVKEFPFRRKKEDGKEESSDSSVTAYWLT